MLDNITTHKKTSVEFADGINVLSGLNGTGKSTVLKMIGFALFDHLAGNQSDYVRDDQKGTRTTGSVTVFFTGKDGNDYRVKRAIGGGNTTPYITHADSAIEMPFSGRWDAFNWIREQMGADKTVDLGNLFKNSIGVDQGTFTAPFLETVARRKTIFSPILNVDVYEKAFKNHLEIQHELDADIAKHQIRISGLEGEISQRGDLLADKEQMERNIKEWGAKKTSTAGELDRERKALEGLELSKAGLEVLKRDEAKQQATLVGKRANLAIIEKATQETRSAKAACDGTKQDHDSHEAMLDKEKKLQQNRTFLMGINDQYVKLDRAHAGQVSTIDEIEKQIADIERKRPSLTGLKQANDRHVALGEEITSLRSELSKIENDKKNYAELNRRRDENRRNLEGYNVDIEELQGLERKVASLRDAEKELEIATSIVTEDQVRVTQALQDKEAAKNGLCPFLNSSCKNIEDTSLESHFQLEIDKYTKALAEGRYRKQLAEIRVETLKRDKERLDMLKSIRDRAEPLRQRLTEIESEMSALAAGISTLPELRSRIEHASEEKRQLEVAVNEYHVTMNKIDVELPQLLQSKSQTELKKATFEESMVPLKRYVDQIPGVEEELHKVEASLKATKMNHDKYVQNKLMANKISEQEADLKLKKEEYSRLEREYAQIEAGVREAAAKFDETAYNDVKQRKETLATGLATLSAIITSGNEQLVKAETKLQKIQEKVAELEVMKGVLGEAQEIKDFSALIRNWFKEAGPIITKALLNNINASAGELFRGFLDDQSIKLEWKEDFDIVVTTPQAEKVFTQLSGGEQMAAALAVRLAIVRVLTNVDFVFFDEPTTNLDPEKRENLAKCIKTIKGFKQLFVISHDDTFERYADHIVHFSKDADETTRVDLPAY